MIERIWHNLTHELIEHDRREERRELKRRGHVNIYRIAHLLGAAQKARAAAGETTESAAIDRAVRAHFCPGFRPAEKFLEWLAAGCPAAAPRKRRSA